MTPRRYILRPAKRALTPTGGFLKGFAYSLNPYAGCAFGAAGGCPFCYVRMLPIARAQPGAWGDWVIAKSNLGDLLAHELTALEAAGRLDRATVFMSSATDPYQGIERRMGLTRAALNEFVRRPVRRVLIQTRSPLIERDADLIAALGARAIVSITLETDDESVRRRIAPTSPSVARRIRTARMLRERGIFVQLAIAPMLPNNPERFAELADAAADRVIIDTYFDGDGSGGARSRALGIGPLYERLGFAQWFRPGAEQPLLAAMRSRLGADRVLFSREGFSAV
ncbi:MAG TPA: radical SAM protein [Candidatus Binataceae bacterium]|nr:radical SAM protein [Candidatus Binataceae bacterium]